MARLHVDRPIWVSREGRTWVWVCRVCPAPHCWCAQDAKTWQKAMTDSHKHLKTHRPATPATAESVTALEAAA